MPMSSSAFSTDLTPNSRLRCLVLLTGCCSALLGIVTILALSAPLVPRLLAAFLWSSATCWQLRRLALAYRHWRRIRLDAGGGVRIESREGQWQPAVLQDGSIVLSQLAWLRIGPVDGPATVELLAGNCRKNKEWRRFRIIWRHLGTAG